MAFVLLPCDLPTWPTVQRHLHSLQGANTPEQVTKLLYTLHSLCNVGIDPDTPPDPLPEDTFAGMERFLANEAGPDFFTKVLPRLVSCALDLKRLKPPQGLLYSLQQQGEDVVVSRELVSSLLAHIFLGTLPRRSPVTHPTLTDPCLASVLASLQRESQRVKLRALLHYFRLLHREQASGDVTFSRKVMSSEDFLTISDWLECDVPLCPVQIQHEGRLEHCEPPCLLACFASPDLAGPALGRHNSQQQVGTMLSFPELLVSSVFVERLEDNEALQVYGTVHSGTVSDLKCRPAFIPHHDATPPDIVHALFDADDYRQSDVLQYEEINVLRELNKVFLAFQQPSPTTVPSTPSDIISVSRQGSQDSASRTARYKTQVSSDSHSNPENKETKEDINKWKQDAKNLQKTSREKVSPKNRSREQELSIPQTETPHNSPVDPSPRLNASFVQSSEGKQNEKPLPEKLPVKKHARIQEPVRFIKDEHAPSEGAPAGVGGVPPEGVSAGNNLSPTEEKEGSGFFTAPTTLRRPKKNKSKGKKSANKQKAPAEKLEFDPKTQPQQNPPHLPKILNNTDSKDSNRSVESKSKEFQILEGETDPGKPKKAIRKPRGGGSKEKPNYEAKKTETSDAGEEKVVRDTEENEKMEKNEKVEKNEKKVEGLEDDVDETTRLLNKVLQAIHKLEQERPELVSGSREAEGQTLGKDEAMEKVPRPKIIARQRGKPPLPEPRNRLEASRSTGSDRMRVEVVPTVEQFLLKRAKAEEARGEDPGRSVGRGRREEGVEVGVARRGRGGLVLSLGGNNNSNLEGEREEGADTEQREEQGGGGGREEGQKGKAERMKGVGLVLSNGSKSLSIYQSCSEDLPPTLSSPLQKSPSQPYDGIAGALSSRRGCGGRGEEDIYFSACESLDGQDVLRPRRPSHKRRRRQEIRRKSSFAERLKESLARSMSMEAASVVKENTEEGPVGALEGVIRRRSCRQHSRQDSGGFVLKDDDNELELAKRTTVEKDAGPEEGEGGEEELEEEQEEEEEQLEDDLVEWGRSDMDEDEDEEGRGSGSSRYSFSSDYTSELDEVYEQIGQLLQEMDEGELGPRTAAVARFAHGLLKRGLSETYKGLTLGLDGSEVKEDVDPRMPRSLSLNERLLTSKKDRKSPMQLESRQEDGRRTAVTGNWGCGSLRGDHQLKAMLQWASISKAGAPKLVYYTCGDQNTVKLAIVCRLLGDRGWKVGEMVHTLLRYCDTKMENWRKKETELTESADSSLPESYRYRTPSLESLTLFDELIGTDRPFVTMETEL